MSRYQARIADEPMFPTHWLCDAAGAKCPMKIPLGSSEEYVRDVLWSAYLLCGQYVRDKADAAFDVTDIDAAGGAELWLNLSAPDVLTKACARCNGTGLVPDGRRKLSDHQRSEIRMRLANGDRGKDLAVEYKVTESAISRIKHNYDRRGSA